MTENEITCPKCGGRVVRGGGAIRSGGRRQRYICVENGHTFVTDELKTKDYRRKVET